MKEKCYYCGNGLSAKQVESFVPGYPFKACDLCSEAVGPEGLGYTHAQVHEVIARNIEVLRRFRNYTQDELAQMSHIREKSYYRRISGETQFRADELVRLAIILRCNPGDFFK